MVLPPLHTSMCSPRGGGGGGSLWVWGQASVPLSGFLLVLAFGIPLQYLSGHGVIFSVDGTLSPVLRGQQSPGIPCPACLDPSV